MARILASNEINGVDDYFGSTERKASLGILMSLSAALDALLCFETGRGGRVERERRIIKEIFHLACTRGD